MTEESDCHLPFVVCCGWSKPHELQLTSTMETSDWTLHHKDHRDPCHFHHCLIPPPTRHQKGLNMCTHRELIREINNEDFFFLMFSNETFVCISCYNSFSDRQTHSWWLCHRKYIWWKVPGVSMAVRGHTTHRQSSTCWRWSPRTFAGLSARPLPPSAPPSPSGQKQSAMWVNILLKQCLLALLSPSLGSADCHKEK